MRKRGVSKKKWFTWKDRATGKWFVVLRSSLRGMPRLETTGAFGGILGVHGNTAYFDSIREANAAARKALEAEQP